MCGVAILPMAFVGLLTLIVVLAVMGGSAFMKEQEKRDKERRSLDKIRARLTIEQEQEREKLIQMRKELDRYKEQLREELVELSKSKDSNKYDALTNYLRSQDKRYNIKREEPILIEVK